MRTFTMTGHIQAKPAKEYDDNVLDGFALSFWTASDLAYIGYTHGCPVNIEIEVPDDFDPRAKTVEILQKKKQELMAEFQKRVNDIDDQIQRFTAITYEAETV